MRHELITPRYSEAILNTPGLASYWRMGEASGSVVDSVGSITGTTTGTVTRNVAGGIAMSFDGSIDFDGSTGYIGFGDNYDFADAVPFTVIAWVNVDTLSNSPRIWSKVSGSDGWRMLYSSTGAISFSRLNSGGTDTASKAGLTTGAWHMVAGTYDGSRLITYLNGVPGTAAASTRLLAGHATALTFGSQNGGGTTLMDGRGDEAAIFTRNLVPGEITELYRIGKG